MSGGVANLTYAALTDTGRRRLANEDAVAVDPHTGMFVVCDGVGGQPSGEAASQITARALPRVFRRQLRRAAAVTPESIKAALVDAAVTMNASMHVHSRRVPALDGMGCTLAAVLIDGPTLYHLHAGDSRVYLLRGGELFPLTRDHTHRQPRRRPKPDPQDSGELPPPGERRLLMQYIGKPEALVPEAGSTPLEPGDRLLLCSDGLTDPIDEAQITRLLRAEVPPTDLAGALVNAANAAGGPDNITVAVIDYAGLRPMRTSDTAPRPPAPRDLPRGAAEQTHVALGRLERDLSTLLQGARDAAHPNRMTALASAKRSLSPEAYRNFLERAADASPLHAFHQCCAAEGSPWRKRYARNMESLREPLNWLVSGRVVLCPVLSAAETARIITDLWRGWRRVEQRYFATCQRDAISETERTLDILIHHMLGSVQTMAGLLTFLPRFAGREAAGAARPSTASGPGPGPPPAAPAAPAADGGRV